MLYVDYLKKTFAENKEFCPFCFGISNRIIAKNKSAFLTYSLAPYHKHHLLVIPFRHTKSFLNLTKTERCNIEEMLKISIKLLRALGYKNNSILMRDNDTENKSIEHLHYNIVPNTRLGDLDHNNNVRKIMTDNEIKKIMEEINKFNNILQK